MSRLHDRLRRLGRELDPERAEADRRTVEAWERANGKADLEAAANAARTRLSNGIFTGSPDY